MVLYIRSNLTMSFLQTGLGIYSSDNVIEAFYKKHEDGAYKKFLEENNLGSVYVSIKRSTNITILVPSKDTIEALKKSGKTEEELHEYVKVMYIPKLICSLNDLGPKEYLGPMRAGKPKVIEVSVKGDKASIGKTDAFIYDIGQIKATKTLSIVGINGMIPDSAITIEDKEFNKADLKKGGLINKSNKISDESKLMTRKGLINYIRSGLTKFNYSYLCDCAAHALSIADQSEYKIAQEMLYPAPMTLLCFVILKGLPLRKYDREMYSLAVVDGSLLVDPWQVYFDHYATVSNKLYDDETTKKYKSAYAKVQENPSGHSLSEILDMYDKVLPKASDALMKAAFDYAYYIEMEQCRSMFGQPTPSSALKIFDAVFDSFQLFFDYSSGGDVTKTTKNSNKFPNNFVVSPAFMYSPPMAPATLDNKASICHEYYNECRKAGTKFTILSSLVKKRLKYATARLGSNAEIGHLTDTKRQNKKDFILSTSKIPIGDIMMRK